MAFAMDAFLTQRRQKDTWNPLKLPVLIDPMHIRGKNQSGSKAERNGWRPTAPDGTRRAGGGMRDAWRQGRPSSGRQRQPSALNGGDGNGSNWHALMTPHIIISLYMYSLRMNRDPLKGDAMHWKVLFLNVFCLFFLSGYKFAWTWQETYRFKCIDAVLQYIRGAGCLSFNMVYSQCYVSYMQSGHLNVQSSLIEIVRCPLESLEKRSLCSMD